MFQKAWYWLLAWLLSWNSVVSLRLIVVKYSLLKYNYCLYVWLDAIYHQKFKLQGKFDETIIPACKKYITMGLQGRRKHRYLSCRNYLRAFHGCKKLPGKWICMCMNHTVLLMKTWDTWFSLFGISQTNQINWIENVLRQIQFIESKWGRIQSLLRPKCRVPVGRGRLIKYTSLTA